MSLLKQSIEAAVIGSPDIEPGARVTACLAFQKDFIGFSGHFPGYPILPAFVQIACAAMLIRRATDTALIPVVLEKAKFISEIHPGDRIRVSCIRIKTPKENHWRVFIHAGKTPAAEFQVILGKGNRNDA